MGICSEKLGVDLLVVGGGLSGICAAIAAARNGSLVALVQDRPVLGGNSSSEIRVVINGATGTQGSNNRYAREGGLVEEMVLRNCRGNPDGNPYRWDALLLDMVAAEPNLRLFLNTVVTDIAMLDPRTIHTAMAHQLMSGKAFSFTARAFIDASGDGVLPAAAGVPFVTGREARDTYGETLAPERADRCTNGSSIMFECRDAGQPVSFVPPAFARDFKANPPGRLREVRRVTPGRSCWAWIEFGGQADWDTIDDNEAIAAELRAIVYGIWDYIKNSGEVSDTGNLELTWISPIPAKRESRRFLGEHVLTQQDIVEQRSFRDTVAHGGWDIDCHPPEWFSSGEHLCNDFPDGPYEVPYGILVPRNVDNLWLAGRSISASHVAFGSLRVQMTLGALGQAAGTAAAIACRESLTNREVGHRELLRLQQTLLRQDQWIMGLRNVDPADKARTASRVTASSVHAFEISGDTWHRLSADTALTFPYTTAPAAVHLEVRSDAERELPVGVWTPARPQNTIPQQQLRTLSLQLQCGRQILTVALEDLPREAGWVVLRLPEAEGVEILGTDDLLTGVLAAQRVQAGRQAAPTWHHLAWIPAFKADGDSPWPPAAVTNGLRRPYGGPNGWCSAPFNAGEPEWLELEWDEPIEMSTVELVFNSNPTPRFQHLRSNPSLMPQVVRDYRILAGEDHRLVHRESDNFLRCRRHDITGLATNRLRVQVEATNGAPCAELMEIRVY